MTGHEAWMGMWVDHLYEDCPNRVSSARTRALPKCSDTVDPEGTDLCKRCVKRYRAAVSA